MNRSAATTATPEPTGRQAKKAAVVHALLGELIAAMLDGFITPCDQQDELLSVLADVDFDEPMTMHRAVRSVHRWRTGGDA